MSLGIVNSVLYVATSALLLIVVCGIVRGSRRVPVSEPSARRDAMFRHPSNDGASLVSEVENYLRSMT